MNWVDTSEMDFHEEFVGESFGRINKQEANLLLQELEAYINRIGKARILNESIDFRSDFALQGASAISEK